MDGSVVSSIPRSVAVAGLALVTSAPIACSNEPADDGSWERIESAGRRANGMSDTTPVLAGGKVVVVAGADYDQSTVKALVIDPTSRRTSPTAPSRMRWRYGYSAVGAGDQVIVWGGCCGSAGSGDRMAGSYDVERDRWESLDPGPLVNRHYHSVVWTGEEMIVWGGLDGRSPPRGLRADGAAYEPGSQTWRSIAPAPLSPRQYHVAVWTGDEMIVWGGSQPRANEQERLLVDGAAYDPERDTWRRLPKTRLLGRPGEILPAGLEPDLDAEWTGEEMTIWSPHGGASYDPGLDRWRRIPAPPAKIRRVVGGQTVWTGEELIAWGGEGQDGSNVDQGAAFNPSTGRWRALPTAPIRGRDRHAPIWTRRGMVVWGGCCRNNGYYADGAIYVP